MLRLAFRMDGRARGAQLSMELNISGRAADTPGIVNGMYEIFYVSFCFFKQF